MVRSTTKQQTKISLIKNKTNNSKSNNNKTQLSLHNIVADRRPLDGLVFNINTVKLYPSLSDTQHGDE